MRVEETEAASHPHLTFVGATSIKIENSFYLILDDTGTTLFTLNPMQIQQSLPQCNKIIKLVGIENSSQMLFFFKPVTFTLWSLMDTHCFIIRLLTPINMLGQYLLQKYKTSINFSPKQGISLTLNNSGSNKINGKHEGHNEENSTFVLSFKMNPTSLYSI